MKRMKCGVLWAALVSVLSLTSCLDGDNTNIQNYNEIMKVDKLTGLYVSQMGYKINPLNAGDLQGVPVESGYIQLHYTYDYTQDMSDGEIDATIYGYSTISEGLWMPQAPTEADADAPVSAVEVTSSDATYFFYKLDDMFLPIEFFVRKGVDTSDLDDREEEMEKHQFTLYYNADEDFTEKGMTLYLRHKLLEVEEDDEFTVLSGGWWHFNIIDAMARYQERYSKRPDKITISFERNTKDISYDEDVLTEGKVDIDYEKVKDLNEALSGSKSAVRLLAR